MNMFSMENVLSGGAIGISLTGMAIVFSGLLLISLSISVLPVILDYLSCFIDVDEDEVDAVAVDEALDEEKDIASVIGMVMQMEAAFHESPEEKEEIDIANVIGLVLHLEQERQFGLPN